jgi:hypothetical protein
MPQTVFFSWQSNTPTNAGRNFLRKALEDACAAVAADASIDEPLRNLEVDSDTQGVAGQPPIVETIFKKIDAAQLFVADMTFVASRSDGDGLSPNPNVLIEYGWALKGLKHERVICVMNTAFGKPSGEALPFDMRHLRWPLCYELDGTESPELRAERRRALTAQLASAIRACLGSITSAAPLRIPVSEFREWASAAGWCRDVHSATIGDNDWWSFAVRLRQAAVDGTITFFGRRYVADYGRDLDTEPLVQIPKEHFAEFEFDPTALAQVDNYDLFTGKIGHSPSEWKGRNFRDLRVKADEAQAWLGAEGKPPPSAEITVGIKTSGAKIGDYRPVGSLVVKNTGKSEFKSCLVQMTEWSNPTADSMPMPFTLRTDAQIRNKERGPFTLLAGQEAMVPLAFHSPIRANEWFLFDENSQSYFIPANPVKLLMRVYGGVLPGSALAFISTDAGWNAMPSVETVPTNFILNKPEEAGKALLSGLEE